jgi:hypothetical protein
VAGGPMAMMIKDGIDPTRSRALPRLSTTCP